MLALEEKLRTLLLLRPDLVRTGKNEEIVAKFTEKRLEVKARRQVYLTGDDAAEFFHYLPPSELKAQVAEHIKGLTEVVVLEHLDHEVVERALALASELTTPVPPAEESAYPEKSIYCSAGSWESKRDIEFFFPHLKSLPVERTLAVIKPDGISIGTIDKKTLEQTVEEEVAALGLFIVAKKRCVVQKKDAEIMFADLKGGPDYNSAVTNVANDSGAVVMCLEGRGAVGKWMLLCGPENSGQARANAPRSLRARWGTDSTCNAVHGSKSLEASDKELAAFFPKGTLKLQRTLCIVKPSAMASLLPIRMEIEEAGFTVLKEKQTTLTEDRAKEFYRDCAGEPTFDAMVQEACSGPCVIMVLCRLEAIEVWKQMMGPLRARFDGEGQANAVHGSSSIQSAAYEVRFFFPDMASDDLPDDNGVRDFMFRKSALASMDLKTTGDVDATDFEMDPTLQQLLSKGLMGLCQVQPKGLDAVKWLSNWLAENNPNAKVGQAPTLPQAKFAPAARTKKFVEYGVNQDGMPYALETPLEQPAKKKVVEVDVSEEPEDYRMTELSAPPFVTFAVASDGPSKSMYCAKLADDFNLVHLNLEELKKQEVAAETYLGTELFKHQQKSEDIPDTVILELLKKTMVKNQDTNRFLIDGFPSTVEQAKKFEQDIAEVAFVLYFKAASDTESNSSGVPPLVPYYSSVGKVRIAQRDKPEAEVYSDAKRYFTCRFLYMLGPPGAPAAAVADRLEAKYGYSCIDLFTLLKNYAASGAKDAAKVKQALAKGKPVDASIACPLILSEIYRDMALGVHNFTLCNFPQSPKQQQFLEHRVPCTSRPLLLDFRRADADDLVAATITGTEILEAETRTAMFFGDEMQSMLGNLKGLVKIPCSLGGLAPETLADAVWAKVCDKVMPGLTIVLGLPGSGTSVLAQRLGAVGGPGTQVVDCDQLLEKEVDRKTNAGIAMQNMLARGQVVPLSMTLELLKSVVNATCSDNLVIENCPSHVDEIEHIAKEFRIDRVFHIAINDQKESGTPEAARLKSIVTYFSRLGKLTRLDVSAALSIDDVKGALDQATLPQFVMLVGDSAKATTEQAELLTAALGTGPAVTSTLLLDACPGADLGSPEEYIKALQTYINKNSASSLFVLDGSRGGYPVDCGCLDYIGAPKLVVNISCSVDAMLSEWNEKNPDQEITPEDFSKSELGRKQKQTMEMMDAFKEKCPVLLLKKAEKDPDKDPDAMESAEVQEHSALIKMKLLPSVYVIVAPNGDTGFSGLVADAISTSKKYGARPTKYTTIDSSALSLKGGHSALTAMFSEALSKGPDPMGTFLVTNFPTGADLPIRDQFMMLGDIANVAGIVQVKLSKPAFTKFCSEDPAVAEAYADFDNAVSGQIVDQFDADKICVCSVDDSGSLEQAAATVATQFTAFRDSGEAAPASGTAAKKAAPAAESGDPM